MGCKLTLTIQANVHKNIGRFAGIAYFENPEFHDTFRLASQGALSGALLGEFILVRIESYHYAIVGLGFGLAALSLANSLLASALARRREIGVLKAVGWRTGVVTRLFLAEGALIGALGGLAGAILGLAVFVGLYETLSPSLAWIAAVGVALPVVVGLLAALYPAQVAANVPPAEAVRYE